MKNVNKKNTVVLSLLLTIIMIFSSFVSFAYAESNVTKIENISSAKEELKGEALKKISSEVLEGLKKEEYVEILVYMKDRVDTENVAEATRSAISSTLTPYDTKLAVRRGVVEALRDTAEKTQLNILKYLEQEKEKGEVLEYTPYHIVNIVYVKTTKEVIENISYMNEVEKIYINETYQMEKPITYPEENSLSSDNELEWNIERVKANQVWEMGLDGTGTVIGTLDSGVDWTHPALKNKWRGYNPETGNTKSKGNWFDPVYYSDLPEDSDTHGTHVMGTALGQEYDGSNKIGVAPGAKWIAARVFNTAGSTTDRILLDAAEWMLAPDGNPDNAPDVVNNSWGGGAGINDWYRDAVRAWCSAGIFPVFSAGNQRQGEPAPWPGSISIPSNYPESFAVAATDRNNIRGSFSKLGPSPYDESLIKPEISAPGVSIRSAVPGGYQGGYSGTSMAAPHISGAVALILSANSSLKVDEIREIIETTAIPLVDGDYPGSPNFGYGYGLINTLDAVNLAAEGTGLIGGRVLKEGEDLEDPIISHKQEIFETFAGSEVEIRAEISDDISITKTELLIKQEGKSYWAIIPMDRILGDHKLGTYVATIPLELLTDPGIIYKIRAVDYAGEVVITEDYNIDVLFGVLPDEFEENFEEEPMGWEFNGSWQWGIPNKGPKAYEGDNVAGTNLEGNYPDKADDWLVTPPLDLRDRDLNSATLRFYEWHELENIFDRGHYLITNDFGENWAVAKPYITGDGKEWKENVINLGDYIGSKNPVFVAFRLTSDASGNRLGWYIDNVKLVGIDNEPPAVPTGLVADAGLHGIKLSWNTVLDADFSHYNIYRSLRLEDGYELITEEIDNSFLDEDIEAGNTYYYKVAAVDYAGNISGFSNVAEATAVETSIIFGNDFEEDDGGFTKGVIRGTENPWEWGVPTSGPNAAFSGEKLWATNLSGSYPNRVDAYIESPTISLPNDKNPILIFNHWVDTEAGRTAKYDYGQVLVSKDSGSTWDNITTESDGNYGGNIREWLYEEISLSNYIGEDIKIRFLFHSDASMNYSGWYIDDVYILGTTAQYEAKNNVLGETIYIEELEGKKGDYTGPVEPSFSLKNHSLYEYEKIEDSLLENNLMGSASGIPVENAIITVLETGRSTRVDPATGKFIMRNPTGKYTIRAEAYGYYSEEKVVNIEKEQISIQNFMLETKPKGNIKGKVFDRYYGDVAPFAKIRVVEDGNIAPVIADENGDFTIEGVYEGTYTLKVVADGFESEEFAVKVIGDEEVNINIPLKRFIGFREEIAYDDGTAENALVINGASYGLAVRFTPPEYGKVTGVNMYFGDISFPVPGGTEIGIAIYDIDEDNRAKRIGEPKIVDIVRGKWNYIDLSEFEFATDKDFYISTIQTKIGDLSPALGVDESSLHGGRSFTNIGGEFRSFIDQGGEGAFMIRALMENIADTPVITNLEEINYTNQDSILVEGELSADGEVIICRNGEEVIRTESENGKFSVELDLIEDKTTIWVALELYDKVTEPTKPIIVIKDKEAPIVEIIKPLDGEKINTEVVHIVGNVYDEYLDQVRINEEIIEVDEDGRFYERLLLDRGENLITISARDMSGNITIINRKVYFGQDIPVISNIEPSVDIILESGDMVEISFNAPSGGEGYFKILLPFNLENVDLGIPMKEENGKYTGIWTVPEGSRAEELIIELIYIDEYETKTREMAPGKIIVGKTIEPIDGEPMEKLPANTVIIGNKAYDIRYLNNNEVAQEELIEWYAEGKPIYIKLSGNLIVNIRGEEVEIEELPEILNYYDAGGNITIYVRN